MFLLKYSQSLKGKIFSPDCEKCSADKSIIRIYRKHGESIFTHSYIRTANLYVFPEGNKSLSILYKTLGTVTGAVIFLKSIEDYKLKKEFSTGKLTVTRNSKLVYTSKGLVDAFEVFIKASILEPGIRDFLMQAFNLYDHEIQKNDMLWAYRVSRNANLVDLPWDQNKLKYLYSFPKDEMVAARRSMNYHLRKGNSKKATEACFYGCKFPKSIHKILVALGPFYLKKPCYKLLEQAVGTIGVDKTRNLLTTVEDGSIDYLLTEDVLNLFCRGFNIGTLNYNSFNLSSDIIDMENAPGIELDNIPETKNLYDYHDYVSTQIEEIRKKGDPKTILFETGSVRRKDLEYKDTTGNYEIITPEFCTELYDLGKKLNNCIASYATKAYVGSITVAVLAEAHTKKPLVCIELIGNHIVQAKLNYNKPVIKDPVIFSVVEEWATALGLVLNCSDTMENKDYSCRLEEPEVPINEERNKAIEEANKTLRALRFRR